MLTQPIAWSEADLNRLIHDQVGESLNLDYKRSDALANTPQNKSSISKDVSSFANSAGGTIVYGIIEKDHIPVALDGGVDPAVTTREWLEQVINSTIHRRVPDIRIHQVLLEKSNPGQTAYVVEIPPSLWAPHMASDNRYYKRFNFESVPMEEYEVRDITRREAERQKRQDYERDNTPYMTIEGGGSEGAGGAINLLSTVHVDRIGVAHNCIFNLFVVHDSGEDHVTNTVIPYLHAPGAQVVKFACPVDFLTPQPRLVRVDALFMNMSNHSVRFSQAGRVKNRVLEMTDAPHYVWPWDE